MMHKNIFNPKNYFVNHVPVSLLCRCQESPSSNSRTTLMPWEEHSAKRREGKTTLGGCWKFHSRLQRMEHNTLRINVEINK